MRYVLPLSMILLASVVLAGDAPKDDAPKSPAAKSALAKLERAKTLAREEYDAAIAKASREAAVELERAKDAAMKAGNLEEANRIAGAIEGTQGDHAVTSFAGTRWEWGGEELLLAKDGVASTPSWLSRGLRTSWEQVDTSTIVLRIEAGRRDNMMAILKASADGRSMRGYDFSGAAMRIVRK
jgi:hypothetical protein